MDITKLLGTIAAQVAMAQALKGAGVGQHPGRNHPAFAGLRESRGLGGLTPSPKPTDLFEATFDGLIEGVAALAKAQEDKKVRLTDAQRIALLLKAETRYAGPVPYERGDIVTPRADSMYENVGKPHVVLEISDHLRFREDYGGGGIFGFGGIFGAHFGHQPDIRVAMITEEGKVAAFWRESWRFEPHPDAPQKAKDDDPDFREVGVPMPGIDPATGTAI